ncbi:hypothetical protein G5S_1015 [Chlamydia pecorum E58]|uniref:Uncharacterized protein n=1 Tax=Chlamydia pecorum (strain ATCC VR-628 / DSM 29919 / E58) TaxID=331635 RepID=A0AA34WIB1_CHLPE|nr:hypothetical protein G5S_1015 [Chlamydia pecorum E58]
MLDLTCYKLLMFYVLRDFVSFEATIAKASFFSNVFSVLGVRVLKTCLA